MTARTYASPVDAGLAKSILDDHEIFCALADEDTNRYSGAPFAVPIRLLVREDQAELAVRILDGDPEAASEFERVATALGSLSESDAQDEPVQNNPWELMAIATLFLFPGLCVLTIKYPALSTSTWRVCREFAAVLVIHFLGWLAIAFAVSLIVTYVYLRRSSIKKVADGVATRVG